MAETEELLWRQLARGDGGAWERFFHATWLPALRYAASRLDHDLARAEDVAGESFAQLLESLARFDPRAGTLGAFLFGILRHRVARARAEQQGERLRGDEIEASAPTGSPHDAPDPEADHAFLSALMQLEVAEREILVQHHQEGVPTAELARRHGVGLEAMQSRRARARRKLHAAWQRATRELEEQRP
jgi:RNA polymerase sigma-70 factor (ECF subfamily)